MGTTLLFLLVLIRHFVKLFLVILLAFISITFLYIIIVDYRKSHRFDDDSRTRVRTFDINQYSSHRYTSSTPISRVRGGRGEDDIIRRTSTDISSSLSQPLNLPSGLANLGNTCYMNSVTQALYATDAIRNYVRRNQRTPLMTALGRLFEDMKSRESSYCSLVVFRNQFVKCQPKFRGYDQQDAQEFLRYLLNGLHDEVNLCRGRRRKPYDPPKSPAEAWEQYRSIDDSPLVDIIAGQLSSVITCGLCSNQSTCWDPFWDLSLPLPRGRGEVNVERCIREFEALEDLDDDERPMCQKCKRPVPATKLLSVERSPSVLILHLKRFTNEGYKLSSPSLLVDPKIKSKSKTYALYACVCHHGSSSRSGHYTAYCQYDNRWFHFNDERVSQVKDFDYERTLEDAYILFYAEASVSSRL